MIRFKQNPVIKLLSSALIFLLLAGNIPLQSQNEKNISFAQATALFNRGEYSRALSLLEEMETSLEIQDSRLKATLYVLCGACYEKLGKTNLATLFYKKVKDLMLDGRIKQLPETGLMDLQSLKLYQQIFVKTDTQPSDIDEAEEEQDQYHFRFKKPDPVSPVDKQEIIYKKAKPKKKKKFPWLPVIISGLVVAGVVAYFLFFRKDSEKAEVEVPEIEWIYIPPGEFLMGDNFNEGDADEQPVHAVYLDGYYISKYVISCYQFDQYCRANQLALNSNLYGHSDLTPEHYLSWTDAEAFCQWLSEETGESIHLPTEAQWERAARGTNQFRYPWGNTSPDCERANFEQCYWGPHWVNDFPAGCTPTGIYNMAGNVWEWCRDYYDASYYGRSPHQNPLGSATGTDKVIRGGYFRSPASEIRSANRDSAPINETGYIGFRIIRETI